jgi:hypothetical protein
LDDLSVFFSLLSFKSPVFFSFTTWFLTAFLVLFSSHSFYCLLKSVGERRPGLAYPELVAPLIIAGFGASAIPVSQNAVIGSVAANEIGKASGAFNMLRQLGAAFGVAILAAVFAGAGSFGTAGAFSNGFAPAMGVSAAISLLGAIVGLILPGRGAGTIAQTKAVAPETRKREASDALEQSPSL